MIQNKIERYLPFLSLSGLFAYFLFDGFFVNPLFRYLFLLLSLIFLLADPLFQISKGNFKKNSNSIIATCIGLISLLTYLIRSWLDIPSKPGMATEASYLPQIREFLLTITVVASIAFLIFTIVVQIGRLSLEAQSQLSDKKKGLLLDSLFGFLMLLPFLIGINYISVMRNYNFDLSAKGKFSLSSVSKTIISQLGKDVEIVAFYPRPLEADGPGSSLSLSRVRPDLEIFLDQYQASSPRIKSRFINADVELDQLADFGQVSNGNILIRSRRENLPGESSIYNEEKLTIKEVSDLEDLERKITSAILNVSTPKRKAYFTTANGERFGLAFSNLKNERVSQFANAIQFLNFQIKELGHSEGWPKPIPEDADLVLIIGPSTAFSDVAQKEILDYVIKRNGKLFISAEPQSKEDFSWLLSKAGVRYKNTFLSQQESKPGFLVAKDFKSHPIADFVSKKEIGIVFPFAGSLETFSDGNNPFSFTSKFLLESGSETFEDSNSSGKIGNSTKQSFNLAVVLQTLDNKKLNKQNQPNIETEENKNQESKDNLSADKEGRVVFYTGTSWLTDQFISYNMNRNLATSSISWMFQEKMIQEIPLKKEEIKTVNLTENQKIMVWFIGIFLYPGLIISIGSYYVISRRKKQDYE
jgi:hypothetical protein